MKKTIRCPHCNTPATLTDGGPYCCNCGWRRARAQENLQGQGKLDIGVIAFSLGVSALFAWVDRRFGLIALVFYTTSYSLMIIWARWQLRKLRAEPTPSALPQPVPSALPDLKTFSPAGRMVQLSQRGREIRAVAAFVSVLALGVSAISASTLAGKLFLVVACFGIMVAAWWGLRIAKRHKRLTAQGTVAIADVTKQWGSGRSHMIEFQFRDQLDQVIREQVQDSTCSLYEDMSVPVFYDPRDPYNNLLAPLSYFEVVGSQRQKPLG